MPGLKALYHFVAHVARRPEPMRARMTALARFGYRQAHKRWRGDSLVVRWEGLDLEVPPEATSAASAYYFGRHDPWEFAFIERFLRPGDGAVDVGANAGVYTMFLARCVGPGGRVVAFEPDGANLAILRRQIERNDLRQVQVIAEAVGEKPGMARFLADRDAVSRLVAHPGSEAGEIEVALTSLDHVFPDGGPLFVKVDVEGFEMDVIKGAAGMMARGLPLVWQLEISDGGPDRRPGELASRLEEAGYRFFRFETARGALVPADWRRPDGNNLLAIRDPGLVQERLARG